MNSDQLNRKIERARKMEEYEMKIIKMAGYLADYYIDRAIESEDYSYISSCLIGYFSNNTEVGYLYAKYKEFGLNEKIEDMDFDITEWYNMKYEKDNQEAVPSEFEGTYNMQDEEYVQYLIEKRKKESEE